MQIFNQNKKAYFNYIILEKLEAGLVLNGQEVKSIKQGRASIDGSYVFLKKEEPYLINSNIPAYQPKNAPFNYNPKRERKILLNKKEINYLIGKTKEKRLTLIPLKIYNKNGRIKLELGIVKGKKKTDKREDIKKRDDQREIERAKKLWG
ncbi:MAG: SsrA-binding protein SmpB [Candidatus Pacebacteria bacterium]|nr:SsrA-binding protein SmpB [Candidatus Paceibacterota bacterium]